MTVNGPGCMHPGGPPGCPPGGPPGGLPGGSRGGPPGGSPCGPPCGLPSGPPGCLHTMGPTRLSGGCYIKITTGQFTNTRGHNTRECFRATIGDLILLVDAFGLTIKYTSNTRECFWANHKLSLNTRECFWACWSHKKMKKSLRLTLYL